jgi:dTDP-4-amino-4,6-dideoxygalactose transaminase
MAMKNILVADVMTRTPITLKPDTNLLECAKKMVRKRVGSLPTQHRAFQFLGHKLGEFSEAEYIGENGLHFGVHQYLGRDDLDHASDLLHRYFEKFK